MSTNRNRNLATFLLVLGAVVFGMVLAGGLQMTVPSQAADQNPNLSATRLAAQHGTTTLPSFADLAEAVSPAVVSIQAATIEKAPANRGGRGGVDPFEFFFGPRNRQQRPQQQQPDDEDGPGQGGPGQGGPGQGEEFRSDAGGSGFVISPDGLVITNNHVVEGATSVKVHLDDRDYPAQVKGVDKATDIALLKIDAGHPLRFVELGDSDAIRVGDWVMVIGNPLNLDRTVTTGVISAKGRSIGISDASFENFIQTDAAINFGNSGGPLLNMQGQVVGIATAINWGAENIGFAVPVNTLKEVLPQLREKGKVSRGYLGLGVRNLDYTQAQAWGLKDTAGALVQTVENGPAKDAGVEHGDVIQGQADPGPDQLRVQQGSERHRDARRLARRQGDPEAGEAARAPAGGQPGRRGRQPRQARGEQRHRVAGHPVPGHLQLAAQRPRHPERRERHHRDQRHADQPALRPVRAAGHRHHRDQRPGHQERRGFREDRQERQTGELSPLL